MKDRKQIFIVIWGIALTAGVMFLIADKVYEPRSETPQSLGDTSATDALGEFEGTLTYISSRLDKFERDIYEKEQKSLVSALDNDGSRDGAILAAIDAGASVEHAPTIIGDGPVFRLKPGQSTMVLTGCGGDPTSEMYKRTTTSGPTLTLHSISLGADETQVDVTFGEYRHVYTLYFSDYSGFRSWGSIYISPDEEQGASTYIQVLRVEAGDIYVRGVRRAC